MRFLCLAYEDEAKLNALSKAEWDSLREETLAYVARLAANGDLVATEALQSARTATTIRVRDGVLSRTDGPFVETKEQIGGYFLIDVPNQEEALKVAAAWPSARLGFIEVRPIEPVLREDSRYR